MPEKKATTEAVVIIRESGNPVAMILGNGGTHYFKLKEMRTIREHADLWEVDKTQEQINKEK